MKIHPVGVELFLADGQTDMTKLIVTFRTSRARLKKGFFWSGLQRRTKLYEDLSTGQNF